MLHFIDFEALHEAPLQKKVIISAHLFIFANIWYYFCSEITYFVLSDGNKTTFLTAHAVLNIKFTSAWTKCGMISQPYCELIESQNCCFDSLKPCSVIVNIVRQFDTPFSVLILTSRFFFWINCYINYFKKHRGFPWSVLLPVLVVWLFSHWCYIECFDLLLRWLVRLISNCFLRTNLFIIW